MKHKKYINNRMKADFVGIFDESFPIDLCNVFVKNYNERN